MRPAQKLAALAFAAIGTNATAASTAPQSCASLLPTGAPAGEMRALAPEDLVRLRDIGPVDPEYFAAPFLAISPDGGRVAFQLRQADPQANEYCLAMVVMDLRAGARPSVIDRGGDPLMLNIGLRGIADFPTGIIDVVTPRWSPDGRWIAFLKRIDGRTEVWRANADGSGSRPITSSASDVVDFRIGADGSTLIYATVPVLDRTRAAIDREGRTGFHYDDRWSPFAVNRPFVPSPVQREIEVLDLATGKLREATKTEASPLEQGGNVIATEGAPGNAQSEPGLSISATTVTGGADKGALHALAAGGSLRTCADATCEGATKPWWIAPGATVGFFRREGWAHASTAIYEWNLRSGSVHRLYLTEDVLADCAPQNTTLICLRDSSLKPRRLERLDPKTGARTLLFDPNPEFTKLTLGQVRRLYFRNAVGTETIADLVLPVGYDKGTHYPLVVVQYDTRGFLRGGTGDDYPIQAFANRGYAVLSFRRPDSAGDVKGAKTFIEGRRLNLAQFADRKSVQSSLERAVQLAVESGVADPKRLGITGLSDGASTVAWSLIHSKMFAATAMSSCCIDTDLTMREGPAAGRDFRSVGYPGALERDDPFWKDLSLSINARRVSTPTLLQLADDEYLIALESYAALREAGQPVDMFVFPDEHHVKSQPAHRLAVYQRSLDWFDYWLRGVRSDAPERQAELAHWDALKAEAASAASP